jgi:hypothetical protein
MSVVAGCPDAMADLYAPEQNLHPAVAWKLAMAIQQAVLELAAH